MNRLEKLKEMVRVNPQDPFLQFAIALEYMNNDKTESVALLEKLVEASPGYVPTYYRLGKLYEEMMRMEEAIEIYRQGIVVATRAGEIKAVRELREALEQIKDE